LPILNLSYVFSPIHQLLLIARYSALIAILLPAPSAVEGCIIAFLPATAP
jgi:hypothetical protein